MNFYCTVAFALSLAFVGYVLFAYPVLMAGRKNFRTRPVHKQAEWKTVSILLPVYNGERWIKRKLESILRLDYPREKLEVLVISDGSDDGTDECAQSYADRGIRLLRIPRSGKAGALNAGMREAGGEILFFTDVRQPLDPRCLKELVACLGDPEVGVASGELIIVRGTTQEEANVGLYWRYEKWIRRRLSQIDSIPGASGSIYAMRRELAVPIPPGTLLDDVYLPMAAFFRGYRVIFEEKAVAYDIPASLETEFRRKVRTQAGVYQVIKSYPELLGPGNRMWIHFVSHKLGRLLLPHALLILALASFGLPGTWRLAALSAQAAAYGLAALDWVVPEKWPLKRITSPMRTFMVLMMAALCGMSILFRPSGAFWREPTASRARHA